MAYVITKDVKYASWHKQVHDWSYQHFPDPHMASGLVTSIERVA